jgi:hypothetical protein
LNALSFHHALAYFIVDWFSGEGGMLAGLNKTEISIVHFPPLPFRSSLSLRSQDQERAENEGMEEGDLERSLSRPTKRKAFSSSTLYLLHRAVRPSVVTIFI